MKRPSAGRGCRADSFLTIFSCFWVVRLLPDSFRIEESNSAASVRISCQIRSVHAAFLWCFLKGAFQGRCHGDAGGREWNHFVKSLHLQTFSIHFFGFDTSLVIFFLSSFSTAFEDWILGPSCCFHCLLCGHLQVPQDMADLTKYLLKWRLLLDCRSSTLWASFPSLTLGQDSFMTLWANDQRYNFFYIKKQDNYK